MARANGCTGSRWNAGAAPATVSKLWNRPHATAAFQAVGRRRTRSLRARRPVLSRRGKSLTGFSDRKPAACGDARRSTKDSTMNRLSFAGLASLASLGVQAQVAPSLQFQPSLDPVIVTATRSLNAV